MNKAVLLNNKLCLYFVPFVITLYSCVGGGVSAQTATLTGVVSDNNGNEISGANITITNPRDGGTRKTKTTESGVYFFPSLKPGQYIVIADCTGFTPLDYEIDLNVGDYIALNFIILPLKPITDTITIQVGAFDLKREDASVGIVFNRGNIEKLPMNGRTFQNLLGLAAGIVNATPRNDECYLSSNGHRCNTNYYLVDGVAANIGIDPNGAPGQMLGGTAGAATAVGTTTNLVSIEALEELRITTSTFAPEFGRTPGVQISIITRSGTNKYHGSIFEYLRNDTFDANDWFNNARQLKKAALRQNNFGGVLGGHIKQDRSFFFFSYEGVRIILPQYGESTVPSLYARQVAPEKMKPFLNAYPLPNGKDLANNFSEYKKIYSDSSGVDSFSVRLDQVVSNKMTLFGRYSYTPSNTSRRGSDENGFPFSSSTLFQSPVKTQTVTIGITNQIGLNKTNDFRFNWSNTRGRLEATLDNFGGAVPFDPNLVFPSSISTENGFFIINLFGGINSRLGVGNIQQQTQRQINFVDTFSIQKNSHLLKFGMDYRKLAPIIDYGVYSQGAGFAGVNGALSGKASVGIIDGIAGALYPVSDNLSLFSQDTWKPTPNLSITFGARWELNPAVREKNGREPFSLVNIDDYGRLDLAPRGKSLYRTTFDNFAPRIGVSYALSKINGREVILRAGFGKYYDVLFSPVIAKFGNGIPYTYVKPQVINAEFPFNDTVSERPEIIISEPFGDIFTVDQNLKLPYSYHWNLALERSLFVGQSLSLSYVGSVGRRLTRQEIIEQPNPRFTSIFLTRNAGSSDYHSLQVDFRRRISKNLQTLAAYTWSHSLDDVSSEYGTVIPLGKIDLKSERASSTYDARHTFNLALTYDFPLPKINKYLDAITHNWSMSSLFVSRSALPVNIFTGEVPEGYSICCRSEDFRPDLVPGVPIYIDDPSVAGGRRINRGAFAIPADRQGSLGRNALRGFLMWQLDFALHRGFMIREKLKFRVGAEIFNVLNHPNFADPGTPNNSSGNILTHPQFGQSTTMLNRALSSTSISTPNRLYSLGGPRSIQFALKMSF